MNYSTELKNRIKKNAIAIASSKSFTGRERETAYIFNNVSMNFLEKTYQNIKKHDKWKKRTEKKHSHFKDGTLEMQSSNSSDALLMNIFCFPEFPKWKGPAQLLEIDNNAHFEFGWNPVFDNEKDTYPTEIDLKIDKHIFEAKLTEDSFTTQKKEVVRSYQDFSIVFDEDMLLDGQGEIKHYQLIRNILAAYKYDYIFTVLLDNTRIDIIREIFAVIKAVRNANLKRNISFVTWQELTNVCGKELKDYITNKYF